MEFYVREADWASEQAQISAIRQQVFVMEQHVPPELEWDGLDETATHLLRGWDAHRLRANIDRRQHRAHGSAGFMARAGCGLVAVADGYRVLPPGRLAAYPDFRADLCHSFL